MASAMLLRGEDYEGAAARDEAAGQIPSTAREVFEMVCVTEGAAEYWIEDQHYKLRPGDILMIPAGTMVGATLKARGCPFERYSVWFSRRYMTFLNLQEDDAGFGFSLAERLGRYLLRLPDEVFESVARAFEALADECDGDRPYAELSAKSILGALIVRVNRLIRQHDDEALLAGGDNRLSPVLTHIHSACTAPVSVDELAGRFSYSPSHLAHSFKNQMGISLYHYVLLRRLQMGREAMLQGVPVKEAYQKCGFGDYAGFYRAFVKEYGLSPQQYKKRNQ